nr:MAG TPA: hypothetical protein [Caudoviricetes sp.]
MQKLKKRTLSKKNGKNPRFLGLFGTFVLLLTIKYCVNMARL